MTEDARRSMPLLNSDGLDCCKAVDTLEPLEMTADTEAQWHQLAKAA